MKPLFTHHLSLNTRLLLAFVASVTLFFIDSRLHSLALIRGSLSAVLYPLQTIATLPDALSEWSKEAFQARQQLKNKIVELERMQLLNSYRLQKLASLQRENMRLRELLGSSFRLTERVMVAEVLTIDLDPYAQQLVINKGASAGVFVGQPVLDAKGVMGQVVRVGPVSSYVMLLTNPSHAVPVQINRNGLRAIISGRGSNQPLQLKYLPHNADVRAGDLIVTSGLGGRFPAGYPIGTVESIHFPQGEAFAEIAVKPAAELAISKYVLLVLPATASQTDVMTVNPDKKGTTNGQQ